MTSTLPKAPLERFTLTVSDGKLLVEPASKLTDSDREFIRNNRESIIAYVAVAAEEIAPTEVAAPIKLPDPARGIVHLALTPAWKPAKQSPVLPLPSETHAWCQEGDAVWTYVD